jgi:glycosyltransferase involved in cell wall biosynthesis
MALNLDFLVFSDDWGRHPSSCQHLFKRIARQHRVLWVNTIGMRLPRPNLYDLRRVLDKMEEWLRPQLPNVENEFRKGNGVHVYSSVSTPINSVKFFRSLNNRLLIRGIRRRMELLGLREPILVTSVPNVADLVGHFGEKKVVYYCCDDFTLWPGVAKTAMEDMERVLLQKADTILAVSAELQRNKRGRCCETHLFPHGTDIGHFQQCDDPQLPVAERISTLQKPVIGYFGLLDERADYDLLKTIALARPKWTLALIGPMQISLRHLESLPNVHLMGQVPYHDLPAYAKGFDVCIMPYALNALTHNINPLKMKEYLATGKPVVSTPVAEAKRLAHALRIGNGYDGFIAAVEDAIARGVTPEERMARVAVLRGQSWEEKAEEFMRLIGVAADPNSHISHETH